MMLRRVVWMIALAATAWWSAHSAADLSVQFKNTFDHAVAVYWDAPGPAGDDVHMFDMPRGESMGVNTFVGHKFYVTEAGNAEPLQYHVMVSSIRQYTFGSGDSSAAPKQCDAATGACDGDDTADGDAAATGVESAGGTKVPKGANEKGEPAKVTAGECQDRYDVCKDYVANGECNQNPGWMTINCPVSCEACHLLDPKVRCDRARLNISDVPVYAPGDMHKMFSSIQERFGERYGVTVLSEAPWVVTFDNFLTDDEVRFVFVHEGLGRSLLTDEVRPPPPPAALACGPPR